MLMDTKVFLLINYIYIKFYGTTYLYLFFLQFLRIFYFFSYHLLNWIFIPL